MRSAKARELSRQLESANRVSSDDLLAEVLTLDAGCNCRIHIGDVVCHSDDSALDLAKLASLAARNGNWNLVDDYFHLSLLLAQSGLINAVAALAYIDALRRAAWPTP